MVKWPATFLECVRRPVEFSIDLGLDRCVHHLYGTSGINLEAFEETWDGMTLLTTLRVTSQTVLTWYLSLWLTFWDLRKSTVYLLVQSPSPQRRISSERIPTSSTSEIIQQTLRPNHKLCAFPHHTKLVCDALVRHNLWKSTLRWSFCSGPAATFIPIRFMLTNVTDKETNKHPEKLIQWATVPCILHAKMFFFLLLRSYTQPFLCI